MGKVTSGPIAIDAAAKPEAHRWSFEYMGRKTDDGDLAPGSVWCTPNGDRGLTFHVSNHSIWYHTYKIRWEFGQANPDGSNRVSYGAVESKTVQLHGHHDETDMTSDGRGLYQIQDNFARINYGQYTFYEDP